MGIDGSLMFQSPEGDSLFFYEEGHVGNKTNDYVSVPRRGFIVFLHAFGEKTGVCGLPRFSPPKGIHCFSTKKEAGQ